METDAWNSLMPVGWPLHLDGAAKDASMVQLWNDLFFPSNAFMASARSFNTFNCMFQIRLQELIVAYTWPSADWEGPTVERSRNRNHPWQVFVRGFLLDPAPFCCLLCFSATWRNACLAGRSCVSPFVVFFVCVCFVLLICHATSPQVSCRF